jgi:ribosomal protein S18 acetylase RimI-like enzyme
MLLERQKYLEHKKEINGLYCQELGEEPVSGMIYFGVIGELDGKQILEAVASVKNYMGSWYLRGCVVRPEYRGSGLQSLLIRERLAYLSGKTKTVRVSVYPENTYSIQNIEKEGFIFEKQKRLKDGRIVFVYKTELS